jgi:hypothetical protein
MALKAVGVGVATSGLQGVQTAGLAGEGQVQTEAWLSLPTIVTVNESHLSSISRMADQCAAANLTKLCCWPRTPVILCHPHSKEQLEAIASARAGLLSELHRVASEWQGVLPTLALQLLQVPRAQWHTVAAVQAMVMNLAAEREAVVGFLHTVINEVRGAW